MEVRGLMMLTLFLGTFCFAQDTPVLKKRPLPPRYDQCHLCHLKKSKPFVPKAKPTQKEHADRNLQHGNFTQYN